ncbi:MAG: hypothetical protein ACKPKO_06630, partial [Candidatus Fonsibacter sp.]
TATCQQHYDNVYMQSVKVMQLKAAMSFSRHNQHVIRARSDPRLWKYQLWLLSEVTVLSVAALYRQATTADCRK